MTKCTLKTKTSYEWENNLDKINYTFLKTFCNTTGKACKLADEYRELNSKKVEEIERDCSK